MSARCRFRRAGKLPAPITTPLEQLTHARASPRSISGSNSPRLIPIRPRCGSARSRKRRASPCDGSRFCSGRFSRRRAGRIRRSISMRPRAATCGAIWSGSAPTLDLPFKKPDTFPQSGLVAARVALVGLEEGWGEQFIAAVYRAQFAQGPSDRRPGRDPGHSRRHADRSESAFSIARNPMRSRRACASRPRRRSASAFSARRLSS